MFIYSDNKQAVAEIKKKAIDCDITLTAIAKSCGIVPQQLNNKFNNSRIALSDLNEWCNAMGCDLVIDFRKREQTPVNNGKVN